MPTEAWSRIASPSRRARYGGGAPVAYAARGGHCRSQAQVVFIVFPQPELAAIAPNHFGLGSIDKGQEARVGKQVAAIAQVDHANRIRAEAKKVVEHVARALRLALGVYLGRDVARNAPPAGGFAGRVEGRFAADAHMHQLAVGKADADRLVAEGLATRSVRQQGAPVLAIDKLRPTRPIQAPALGQAAPRAGDERGRQLDHASAFVELPGPIAADAQQLRQTPLLHQGGIQRAHEQAAERAGGGQAHRGKHGVGNQARAGQAQAFNLGATDPAVALGPVKRGDDQRMRAGQHPGRCTRHGRRCQARPWPAR